LIKFYEGIKSLEEERSKYPVYTYRDGEKDQKCLIPFSSEIKFNLYIRDMNPKDLHPRVPSENLMIVMKGAPERILKRCNKILINGEEIEFNDYWQKIVKKANDKFGKQGERVLAFARLQLDPSIFTKDP
jgi:magnesium-transporting ATPase (P-type)